ncbi:MAG: SPOR domain-containing protein [Balneolales bacterium]
MKVSAFNLLPLLALPFLLQACGPGADRIREREQRERDAAQRETQEEIMVYEAMELIKSQSLAIARGEVIAPEPVPVEIATAGSASPDPSGHYTIQVASLDTRARAGRELEGWKQRGYNDAYISEYRNAYRVRLGRYATRQDAQDQARQVNGEYNISTWVTETASAHTGTTPATSSPGRYSIQVAAVASKNSADRQINSWKERGFAQAYAQEVQNNDATLYRIRLGHFDTITEARDVKSRIKDSYGTDSVIFDM